ncbi:hypothetical protein A9Q99_17125 [Gammaproteobacteria bacterium 45_16_T64]|nr:hypothetical protein A9Q99_17125 [Gammaproteobacteria bacterium 45_16_T64]
MPTILPTPDSISITPRRLHLEFDGLETTFVQGNPVLTSLFCSLSAVFPPGERQFIDSVRYYQDQVTDPEMKKRVRAFIGQEAHHGNLHEVFNDKIQDLGWRTDLVERQTTFINKFIVYMSPERQLAQTVALEHLTALFANFLMNNPDFLGKNPHPDLKTLFMWHAVEETEHKAVAYDLYQQVVGNDKLRKAEMRFILPVFMGHMFESTALLLMRNKKLSHRGGWLKTRNELFGKHGVFTAIKAELNEYYDDEFHPWQTDNSALANNWLQELAL